MSQVTDTLYHDNSHDGFIVIIVIRCINMCNAIFFTEYVKKESMDWWRENRVGTKIRYRTRRICSRLYSQTEREKWNEGEKKNDFNIDVS